MSNPNFQSRDELFRRWADGTYELVPNVVPRVELDKVLNALRKERVVSANAERRTDLVRDIGRLLHELKERA